MFHSQDGSWPAHPSSLIQSTDMTWSLLCASSWWVLRCQGKQVIYFVPITNDGGGGEIILCNTHYDEGGMEAMGAQSWGS